MILSATGPKRSFSARVAESQAGDESQRHGSDERPERVLLRDTGRAAGGSLHLISIRERVAAGAGNADLLLHGIHRARNGILRRLDRARHRLLARPVRSALSPNASDRLTHSLACVNYFAADRVRVFTHCTSSFTVSMV